MADSVSTSSAKLSRFLRVGTRVAGFASFCDTFTVCRLSGCQSDRPLYCRLSGRHAVVAALPPSSHGVAPAGGTFAPVRCQLWYWYRIRLVHPLRHISRFPPLPAFAMPGRPIFGSKTKRAGQPSLRQLIGSCTMYFALYTIKESSNVCPQLLHTQVITLIMGFFFKGNSFLWHFGQRTHPFTIIYLYTSIIAYIPPNCKLHLCWY